MKQKQFLVITAIIAWIFGLTMMIAPEKMLNNLTTEITVAVKVVMQWVGVGIFSIGCMNFISRNDLGSSALIGVMTGNIILHILGLGFDFLNYNDGIMKITGLVMGIIVHLLMVIGFTICLMKNQSKVF